MRILVYGGGAVGLGVASCLIKTGEDVDIIARADTAALLNEKGLTREGIFGTYNARAGSFGSYSSLKDLPRDPYLFILVTTKAHDSEEAARDLSSHSPIQKSDAKIVLFQNGWGNARAFTEFFPEDRVFNARVITGFVRHGKNRVEVTVHADAIHVGSLFSGDTDELAALCASISQGGIPCELTGQIGRDLWAKMLYNCALNALGTIFAVPYGVLGEFDYTRDVMERIVEEVFLVMRRLGHETHWESPGDYMEVFYEKLLPPTARHEPSMLQDIRMNKKTEIDYLNGAIVTLGKETGCATPVNLVLSNMVKFLETRTVSR